MTNPPIRQGKPRAAQEVPGGALENDNFELGSGVHAPYLRRCGQACGVAADDHHSSCHRGAAQTFASACSSFCLTSAAISATSLWSTRVRMTLGSITSMCTPLAASCRTTTLQGNKAPI